MNTITLPTTSPNKPLWAAVGVLAVAVLGLGGGLVYTQTRPAAEPVATQTALLPATGTLVSPSSTTAAPAQDEVAPPPKAPVVVAPHPPVVKKVVKPAPVIPQAPAHSTANGSVPSVVAQAPVIAAPPPPVARPVCANCGTIESVTPVVRKGKGSGLGAVGGGVLGAVLGNQVGKGSGRSIATVIGAVGGGLAGNAIEKNVKKETVYEAHVRMEDGSTRSFEQATMPAVGSHVVVENGAWHAVER